MESLEDYVEIQPYLFPATRRLLEEINQKLPEGVMLRKVSNSISFWQICKTVPWHIDMPESDEGNVVFFTHELLHIYFNFCLGMRISDYEILFLPGSYSGHFQDQRWYLPNQFITLINHLQHHKMVPYYEEYGFPLEKLIVNFSDASNLFEVFQANLNAHFEWQEPVHRYVAALCYINYLCLELFFPNPEIRSQIHLEYAGPMDIKFPGLRAIFSQILLKWDTDFWDLRSLIFELNDRAKVFAEEK